jgi:FkbM family methyltransferase
MSPMSLEHYFKLKCLLRSAIASILRHFPKLTSLALIEMVHKGWLAPKGDADAIVQTLRRDGTCFLMDLRMEYVSYYRGEYEPDHLETLLSLLPAGGTFIDVGANIGYFAVTVGHRRRTEGCHVYAFEPLARNFEYLLENIQRNGLQHVVAAHNIALSDKKRQLTVQLFAETESRPCNAVVLSDWQGYEHLHLRSQVNAISFDEWAAENQLARFDVAKIDVEGHEPQVLRGMLGSLKKYKPAIYAECNISFFRKQGIEFADVQELLSNIGYVAYQIVDGRLQSLNASVRYAQDVFFLHGGGGL